MIWSLISQKTCCLVCIAAPFSASAVALVVRALGRKIRDLARTQGGTVTVAECFPHKAGRIKQTVNVNTGLDAHLIHGIDKVLSGDIAGRTRRVGAAAQPGDRRIKVRNTSLHGGKHVGHGVAVGVVRWKKKLISG